MTSNTILDAEVIRLDLQREQSNKINGAKLLFEICEFLGRFVCYPGQVRLLLDKRVEVAVTFALTTGAVRSA
jgi:hypothetical protein